MTRPSRRLAEEWARRLRRTHLPCGYWDNEIISNRGMPTRPITDDDKAYPDFAADVLRFHRFRSRRDRWIWRLHAAGDSSREVARKVSRDHHTVLDVINRIKREVVAAARIPSEPDELTLAVREWVRLTDPRTLVVLVELFTTARAGGDELTPETLLDAARTPEQLDLLRLTPEEFPTVDDSARARFRVRLPMDGKWPKHNVKDVR